MDKLVLLKWYQAQGTLLIGDEAIHFDEKPDLGFPYDFLHYEPAANIQDVLRPGESTLTKLLPEEHAACVNFAEQFIDEAAIPGSAYDPNRDNVYMGRMSRVEAHEAGLEWTIRTCPYVVGLYDPKAEMWLRVKALITDLGYFSVDPDGICPRCTLFFTEEQWAAFTKPEPLEWYYRWDFAKEVWYDSRTVDQVRNHVVATVTNNYEARRSEIQSRYIQAYELYTWTVQQEEAAALIAFRSTTPDESLTLPTPFLDACLKQETVMRQQLGLPAPDSKEALARLILDNNQAFREASGKLHGEMRAWLTKAYSLETIPELEALLIQFQTYMAKDLIED